MKDKFSQEPHKYTGMVDGDDKPMPFRDMCNVDGNTYGMNLAQDSKNSLGKITAYCKSDPMDEDEGSQGNVSGGAPNYGNDHNGTRMKGTKSDPMDQDKGMQGNI